MKGKVALAVVLYILAFAVPVTVLWIVYGPAARVDPKSAKDLLFLAGGCLFAFGVGLAGNAVLHADRESIRERLSSYL
jgi:hypothetical protein